MNRENLSPFSVVIVGGGFSGLVSSIILSQKLGGENVLLIEKLPRVGKKILSTGNGQCNLSNNDMSVGHFHTSFSNGLDSILCDNIGENIKTFFNKLGVMLSSDDGKIYPMSKQASSVLDALRFKVEELKTNVLLDSEVVSIKKEDFFSIRIASGKIYKAKNVIIAVGGKAQKHMGTDGSAYSLLTNFGHRLTPLYPSLVQLKTDTKSIQGLKGLKHKANVKAIVDNKVVAQKDGEVLFTEYGVSGNAIFYLSSYVAGKNASISIDFFSGISKTELTDFLIKKLNSLKYLTLEYLLLGLMPNKIAIRCLKNSGFDDLSKKPTEQDIVKIASTLKDYKIKITGTLGFDNAQVTKGGIMLDDFNLQTLESKLVKGLYATGEVLDVDGDCGGYNLEWAYRSAVIACNQIK